jgi:thioredoxin-dependent peroxiredoxin
VSFHQGNIVPEEKNPRVGDLAPEFTLPASDGETVSLSDFRGRAEVVLFFYPKDNSPACSVEACSFRDSYETFRDAGAEVIGISADSPKSHSRFAKRFRLPFRLLSDAGGSVRSRYGVNRTFGLIPGRVTFLIDKQGIVRHVFSSQFQPFKHVSEMLGILRKLREHA